MKNLILSTFLLLNNFLFSQDEKKISFEIKAHKTFSKVSISTFDTAKSYVTTCKPKNINFQIGVSYKLKNKHGVYIAYNLNSFTYYSYTSIPNIALLQASKIYFQRNILVHTFLLNYQNNILTYRNKKAMLRTGFLLGIQHNTFIKNGMILNAQNNPNNETIGGGYANKNEDDDFKPKLAIGGNLNFSIELFRFGKQKRFTMLTDFGLNYISLKKVTYSQQAFFENLTTNTKENYNSAIQIKSIFAGCVGIGLGYNL